MKMLLRISKLGDFPQAYSHFTLSLLIVYAISIDGYRFTRFFTNRIVNLNRLYEFFHPSATLIHE